MLIIEVIAQTKHMGEIMRANLDGGFPHLERRLGHRMRASLDDANAQSGILLLQLQRQRQPGQATA